MYSLYLIYIGGKSKTLNIESHDVIFVVGKSIEDIEQILNNKTWLDFDNPHIDSYIKINYIEGYKVLIIKIKIKK